MIYAIIGTIACLLHAVYKKSAISALIGIIEALVLGILVVDSSLLIALPHVTQVIYGIAMVSPIVAILSYHYQQVNSVKSVDDDASMHLEP